MQRIDYRNSDIDVHAAIFKNKQVWFVDERLADIDGLYRYEIMHDEHGYPLEIGTVVLVDFYGTVLTTEELELPNERKIGTMIKQYSEINAGEFYITNKNTNIRILKDLLESIKK